MKTHVVWPLISMELGFHSCVSVLNILLLPLIEINRTICSDVFRNLCSDLHLDSSDSSDHYNNMCLYLFAIKGPTVIMNGKNMYHLFDGEVQ